MKRKISGPAKYKKRIKKQTQTLEDIASRSPRWEGTVHRGAQINPDDLEVLKNSDTWMFPSFNSSSTSKNVAETFNKDVDPPLRQVLYEIDTKTGMNMTSFSEQARDLQQNLEDLEEAGMDDVLDYLQTEYTSVSYGDSFEMMTVVDMLETEEEVLLMPNSYYKVVQVKDSGRGPVRVKLQEIVP